MTLVFLLEEPSAEAMLKGLLPRILPDTVERIYTVFEGKQDMEKRLGRILRGWQKTNCVFVVMRDQDSAQCQIVKSKLLEMCRAANRQNILVRIACRELESFYLGDLDAVEKGMGVRGLAKKQDSKKYRMPDRLQSPSKELEILTKGKYQKVSGSRTLGPLLKLEGNRSRSFNALLSGILRVANAP